MQVDFTAVPQIVYTQFNRSLIDINAINEQGSWRTQTRKGDTL